MATAGPHQRFQTPTAPIKGSFPMDHNNECKAEMLRYMLCLNDEGRQNSLCRDLSKAYFQCRMDKNLMAKEDWRKLGFNDDKKNDTKDPEEHSKNKTSKNT